MLQSSYEIVGRLRQLGILSWESSGSVLSLSSCASELGWVTVTEYCTLLGFKNRNVSLTTLVAAKSKSKMPINSFSGRAPLWLRDLPLPYCVFTGDTYTLTHTQWVRERRREWSSLMMPSLVRILIDLIGLGLPPF